MLLSTKADPAAATVPCSNLPGLTEVWGDARRTAIAWLQLALTLLGLVPLLGSVFGLLSSLDEAWLLWDPRRQCLHDKIADTLVEQKPPRR